MRPSRSPARDQQPAARPASSRTRSVQQLARRSIWFRRSSTSSLTARTPGRAEPRIGWPSARPTAIGRPRPHNVRRARPRWDESRDCVASPVRGRRELALRQPRPSANRFRSATVWWLPQRPRHRGAAHELRASSRSSPDSSTNRNVGIDAARPPGTGTAPVVAATCRQARTAASPGRSPARLLGRGRVATEKPKNHRGGRRRTPGRRPGSFRRSEPAQPGPPWRSHRSCDRTAPRPHVEPEPVDRSHPTAPGTVRPGGGQHITARPSRPAPTPSPRSLLPAVDEQPCQQVGARRCPANQSMTPARGNTGRRPADQARDLAQVRAPPTRLRCSTTWTAADSWAWTAGRPHPPRLARAGSSSRTSIDRFAWIVPAPPSCRW